MPTTVSIKQTEMDGKHEWRKKQERRCGHWVILMSVRVNIVAVEKR
jgi:hypothetical protein